MGTADLLARAVFSLTWLFVQSITRRSSPWLVLNVVTALHSEVKVHGSLVASVLCNFQGLNLGISLPEQLLSFNVLWEMEARC